MHYFFLENRAYSSGDVVRLSEHDCNHAYRVLRLQTGDEITVSDGRGRVNRGVVTLSEAHNIQVRIGHALEAAQSPLDITLCQSLSKGEKMDLVIRQAVELGINRFIPMVTGRSVARFDRKRETHKAHRWKKIIRSAAAQSRRGFIPVLDTVKTLEELIAAASSHLMLVPYEGEKEIFLADRLKQPAPRDGVVFLFIGPEGGFDGGEIEALKNAGAQIVSLGPRIMRLDTAAAASLAMLQGAWGDLTGEGLVT